MTDQDAQPTRQSRQFTPVDEPDLEERRPRRARRFEPDADERLSEVPPSVTSADALPGARELATLELERLPVRGLRTLGWGLLILIVITAGAELVRLFDAAWQLHWSVAALLGTLFGGVGLLAFRTLLSYLGARRSLDRLDRLRHHAEQLEGRRTHGRSQALLKQLQDFYADKPQAALLAQTLDQLPDYSDDSEILTHLDRHFLARLDREAMQRISRYSAETGVAVAFSPWAALDMLLALWRSLRMIDNIAQVYGVAPSLPTRLRLLRRVLHQLAFVGASEVLIDQLADDLGTTALAGALSARAGQGIGAGIMSARIGLAGLRLLRPLPFADGEEPGIRTLVRPLIETLKTKFSHRTAAATEQDR